MYLVYSVMIRGLYLEERYFEARKVRGCAACQGRRIQSWRPACVLHVKTFEGLQNSHLHTARQASLPM